MSRSSSTCRWLLHFLIGTVVFTNGGEAAIDPESTAPSRPNIIYILTDDLGYGDVGVFFQNQRRASGNAASMRTPNLDAMASQGALLTDHYCAAPVCAPSRASFLTGLHQGHANVRDNQFDKALADNHTIGGILQLAGYSTAAIGKWGLQGNAGSGGPPDWPAHPLQRGFDSFYGYMRHRDGHEHYPKEAPYRNRDFAKKNEAGRNAAGSETDEAIYGKEVWENRTEVSESLDLCYTTDLFTARAKRWIVDQHTATPTKPFFLYLAYDTPHVVLEYPPCPYPTGRGLNGGLQWLGTPGHMTTAATGKVDSYCHPDYADATYRDPKTGETRPWPDVYRRHASSVRRLDDAVADLLQLLTDLKIDRNTLVVFTSDNGPEKESFLPEPFSPEFFAGYGPFDGIKRDVWEGGIRVPTLVRWPARIPGGITVTAPSAQWDWLPTFAALAGVPAPANSDGVSLIRELTGGGGADRTAAPLYFEYAQNQKTPGYADFEASRRNRQRGQMQALRLGDIVGIRYDVKSADDLFELYNVRTDPKQSRNLAHEPEGATMQAQMKAAVLQTRRPDSSAPRPYDNASVPASDATPKAKGVTWARFEGDFRWLPSTEGWIPTEQGVANDLSTVPGSVRAGVVTVTGFVVVPKTATYTVSLSTSTAALLRLHTATVFDCDKGYDAGTERTALISLEAGMHPFRFTYRVEANTPAPAAVLQWSDDGNVRQPIPANAFRY